MGISGNKYERGKTYEKTNLSNCNDSNLDTWACGMRRKQFFFIRQFLIKRFIGKYLICIVRKRAEE
jgi:hypothetical protein